MRYPPTKITPHNRLAMGVITKDFSIESGPSGARTLDPNIKSVVLYQLS